MRIHEIITENTETRIEKFQGVPMKITELDDEVDIKALDSQGNKVLGHVTFSRFHNDLEAKYVEVDERYRGQGIAQLMYDFATYHGYKISRSYDQTDAGAGFWNKHRGEEETVWEDAVPQVLYHATYRPLLKSIKQYGLGGDRAQAKWEDSKPGVVYLATSPDVAESYAESSEAVPDEWLDAIVVLKINVSGLDRSKLMADQNVLGNQGDTLEYHGVIPVSLIS